MNLLTNKIANFRFKCKYQLKAHKQVHIGKKFQCSLCGKQYGRKAYLIVHMESHSGIIAKQIRCDICDKAFRYSSNMYCHRRTHTGSRAFKCDVCNSNYGSKNELNRHFKRVSHLNKLKELSDVQPTSNI